MQTLEAYLDRKHEEVTLLNGFLGNPFGAAASGVGG